MKRKNYALIACLLCLALILGGCALTVGQVKKDPTAQVIMALDNTIKSLKSDIPFTMPKGLDKECAADMKITGIPGLDDGITLNYASKADDDSASLYVSTGIIGDIGLYYKKGEYALSGEALIGENVIGLDTNTIKEDLKDSALLEALDISYDELIELIDSRLNSKDYYNEILDNFEKAFKDVFVNCETDVTEETVKTNGEDAKAICVTYNMNKDTYIAVVNAYKEFFDALDDSMSDEYSESFDEIINALEKSDAESKLTFAINPDEKIIMQVSLDIAATMDGEEDNGSIVLDLGKVPAKSDKFIIEIKDAEDTSSVIYDRTDKDGKFCRRIFSEDSEDDLSIEFVYDKDKGDYTLTFSDAENIVIGGNIKSNENEMNITVDKIEIPDTDVAGLSVSLTVKNTADVKALPDYKKITDMTADELEAIIAPLESIISSLYGEAYSHMYEFDPTYDYNGDGVVNEDDADYFDNHFSNSDMMYYVFDSTFDYNFDGVVNDDDKAYFDKYYGEDSDYSYMDEFDPNFDYDSDGDFDNDDKVYFDTFYKNIGDLL